MKNQTRDKGIKSVGNLKRGNEKKIPNNAMSNGKQSQLS